MQECKYASILSRKFSTKILPGPNFFKPSVPGDLRVFRAFASLFYFSRLFNSNAGSLRSRQWENNEMEESFALPWLNANSNLNKCDNRIFLKSWHTFSLSLSLSSYLPKRDWPRNDLKKKLLENSNVYCRKKFGWASSQLGCSSERVSH